MKREAARRKGKLKKVVNFLCDFRVRRKSKEHLHEATIALGDLEHLRVLGTGTFGQVTLVRHSPTGCLFALKALSKHKLAEMRQIEKRIFIERDTLRSIQHTSIVTLYVTASDASNLYMFMELLPGGEFWGMLYHKHSVLPWGAWQGPRLPHAKFYASNALSVLSYLQDRGIVYCDMKPENLVLDARG